MSKRASGRVRHLVRVELVAAVAERGPHPWPSARRCAAELADRLDLGVSTVRRALADPTLAAEVSLAIGNPADPVIHDGIHPQSRPAPPGSPDPEPLADAPPDAVDPDAAPYVSTRPLLSDGPAVLPPASAGRRPKEYRRSRFPARCVVCLVELEAGQAFYLTPYDTGTTTACLEHAPLVLAAAQMTFDVIRGRDVPEALELFVRPNPLPPTR